MNILTCLTINNKKFECSSAMRDAFYKDEDTAMKVVNETIKYYNIL
jgi:hypothetical protein